MPALHSQGDISTGRILSSRLRTIMLSIKRAIILCSMVRAFEPPFSRFDADMSTAPVTSVNTKDEKPKELENKTDPRWGHWGHFKNCTVCRQHHADSHLNPLESSGTHVPSCCKRSPLTVEQPLANLEGRKMTRPARRRNRNPPPRPHPSSCPAISAVYGSTKGTACVRQVEHTTPSQCNIS